MEAKIYRICRSEAGLSAVVFWRNSWILETDPPAGDFLKEVRMESLKISVGGHATMQCGLGSDGRAYVGEGYVDRYLLCVESGQGQRGFSVVKAVEKEGSQNGRQKGLDDSPAWCHKK
jgi:hypothetical protein